MKANKLEKVTVLFIIFIAVAIFSFSKDVNCQNNVRTEIKIPDVLGYKTLKCDLHMHTVFSDGDVWPTTRVQEAWREGFDAISITDHIEYLPHKADVPKNHNRPYELAKPEADKLDILLIRGGEITREIPPGHFNAIFLSDVDALDTKEWKDAIKNAYDQGGFVFWNHPGWRQPNQIPVWYDEVAEVYEKGWVKGMEIVNYYSYYPLAHEWCLSKKFTMLGNSDIHPPINMDFNLAHGDHRPMTLIFAKERTVVEIKKALLDRRTAVYYKNLLIGEKIYLKPIFDSSIVISKSSFTIKGLNKVNLTIHNNSDFTFDLVRVGSIENIDVPRELTIHANKTVIFQLKGKSKTFSAQKKVKMPFKVNNLLISPEQGLPVEFVFDISFVPEK